MWPPPDLPALDEYQDFRLALRWRLAIYFPLTKVRKPPGPTRPRPEHSSNWAQLSMNRPLTEDTVVSISGRHASMKVWIPWNAGLRREPPASARAKNPKAKPTGRLVTVLPSS